MAGLQRMFRLWLLRNRLALLLAERDGAQRHQQYWKKVEAQLEGPITETRGRLAAEEIATLLEQSTRRD